MVERKYYVCPHCGNFITMIKSSAEKIRCCGEDMKLLELNNPNASAEKHLPVIELTDNKVIVNVGNVEHPMAEEHYIEWIYIQTKNGGQAKCLKPNQKPCAEFLLNDDELIAAYAYCNLHGLWMTKFE